MTGINESGPVGTYPISGSPNIDPLVWLGYKWGSSGAGTAAVVTYSFPTSTSKWSNDYKTYLDNEPFNGFSAFTVAQQTAAQQAMALWSEVANITFQQVTETATDVGDIRFGNSRSVTQSDAAAWAYTPYDDGLDTYPENGDIWVDRGYAPNLQLQPGQFGFETMLHEIGHAIGLDHPFQDYPGYPGEPVLSSIMDNQRYTLMSYNIDYYTLAYSSGPQVLDILAIQYLYGANMTTRAGDDVYSFSTTVQLSKAIWDAGGHDTFDFSNQKYGVEVDLAEGCYSLFCKAPPNTTGTSSVLGIAYGAIIEDAIGTNLADKITGNQAANHLTARSGNDTIIGYGGDDILDGGAGDDTMRGGAGNDIYYVDTTADRVFEDASYDSDDWIYSSISINIGGFYYAEGYIEHLKLLGSESIDALGNAWDNVIIGNGGDNLIMGYWGSDTLIGGSGNDTYRMTDFNDTVVEDADGGTDTIIIDYRNYYSSFTLDLNNYSNIENAKHEFDPSLFLAGLGGTLIGTAGNNALTGNIAADTLIGGLGDDFLDGGTGDDLLKGGGGNDTYMIDSAGDVVDEEGSADISDTVRTTISVELSTFAGGAIEHVVLLGSSAINAIGNGAANALIGNGADNLLDGKAGTDTMTGGAGNDTYVVDDAADQVIEQAGGGTDHVISSVSFNASQLHIEKITLSGGGDVNAIGNALANSLTGNGGSNLLDGGLGNDTLKGGAGNDTYVIESAADLVDEEGNSDLSDRVISTMAVNLATFAGGAIENATILGKAALALTGNGAANILIGNDGANLIDGAGGDDRLEGGLGNDIYSVDSSSDKVIETTGGASGGLDLVKSTASFALGANLENLTLLGSGTINGTGNGLNNILTGNAGANRLDGGAGADKMIGGLGNDVCVIDHIGDIVTELANGGIDTIETIFTTNLALKANFENLTLLGSADISALGTTLANTLTGNSGNNLLDGRAGADVMKGGAGNDVYVIDNLNDIVDEEGHLDSNDWIKTTVRLGSSIAGIEKYTYTGSLAWSFAADTLDNSVSGGAGADTLDGAAGSDTLLGNGGNDLLLGGIGDDLLDGGAGNDKLKGGAGNDAYVIGSAGDVIDEQGNLDSDDRVRSSVTVSLLTLAGGAIEHVVLTGAAAISATGNASANELVGNDGANLLDGNGGADTLIGGKGGDIYVVDSADDVVIESIAGTAGGIDTIKSYIDFDLSAYLNIEKLTLAGPAQQAIGNALANTLTGNAEDNFLDGGAGKDTMIGGAGDDTYIVNMAGDVVSETVTNAKGGGIDTVESGASFSLAALANVENLTLTGNFNSSGTGNALANRLSGNGGSNILNGGAGDDWIDGGLGFDRLTGGTGRDTFDYDLVAEGGDTITDFKLGATGDVLDLSDVLDAIGYAGSDAITDGFVLFGKSGLNTVVSIDVDGTAGPGTATVLTTLINLTLTAANSDNYLL